MFADPVSIGDALEQPMIATSATTTNHDWQTVQRDFNSALSLETASAYSPTSISLYVTLAQPLRYGSSSNIVAIHFLHASRLMLSMCHTQTSGRDVHVVAGEVGPAAAIVQHEPEVHQAWLAGLPRVLGIGFGFGFTSTGHVVFEGS